MAQFEELKQAVAVDARNLDIAWIVLCSECLLLAFATQRLRPRIVTVVLARDNARTDTGLSHHSRSDPDLLHAGRLRHARSWHRAPEERNQHPF